MRAVSGEFEIGSQYHFHMETQSCIVTPKEDGQFEVFSATQWMDNVQHTISGALGIPDNKIDVQVWIFIPLCSESSKLHYKMYRSEGWEEPMEER